MSYHSSFYTCLAVVAVVFSLASSEKESFEFPEELPQVTACLNNYSNLTEGWFNPDEFTPIFSQCSRYGAGFRPAEGRSCSDYMYTIKANFTSIEATDIEVSTSYEESILICIVSFPVPIMKNQPIRLDLLAARSKPFKAVYCLCDLIPHYVDVLPQVENITANVLYDSVNITWTLPDTAILKIDEYILTISELNITSNVNNTYTVFKFMDGFGLRPESLYNVTVVPAIYCKGNVKIGNGSSSIISTFISHFFVSENLTYTVCNVSGTSAFLQLESAVLKEVCISVSVKLDCEGRTTINDTYEVYVTPDHTVLVNVTVPVDKTCTGTLKWMIKDIEVLIQQVTLKSSYQYLSKHVTDPVFIQDLEMKPNSLIICCSVHAGGHQGVFYPACNGLPHSQNILSQSHECNDEFHTVFYYVEYSPTDEPEPSSCSTSTATVTMTVTIHSNSSSSGNDSIPGCEYYVAGLSGFSTFLIVIIIETAVAICIIKRQKSQHGPTGPTPQVGHQSTHLNGDQPPLNDMPDQL